MNRDEIAALYDTHAQAVYRFCLRLCAGCAAEAEDIAQETWLAAFQGMERFDSRAKITTYLHGIALNIWRKRRRIQARTTAFDADAPLPDGMPDRLTRLTLNAAVARLPDAHREAFVLVKAEGYSSREAAHLLCVPTGTVQFRVFQAVRRLRVLLTDLEEAR